MKLKNIEFNIKELLIIKDVRPDREETWLNVILKKWILKYKRILGDRYGL